MCSASEPALREEGFMFPLLISTFDRVALPPWRGPTMSISRANYLNYPNNTSTHAPRKLRGQAGAVAVHIPPGPDVTDDIIQEGREDAHSHDTS